MEERFNYKGQGVILYQAIPMHCVKDLIFVVGKQKSGQFW